MKPQHKGITQNFTDAILKGTPLMAPGKEGINGLRIANAMFLSSWLGKEVELPVDGDLFYKMLQDKIASSTYVKSVKEQRVDDLMDILDAGIVHSAASSGLRIKRTLEHSTEDCRTDLTPIKIITRMLEQQSSNLIIQPWNLDTPVSKQTAINVWESQQSIIKIRFTLRNWSIQNIEKINKRPTHIA